jgi:peptide/nickel transport system substrate-binding protein
MGENLAQDWLFDHEAGTGPYMLESWDPGQQTITMVKFPDYWGGWEGQHLDKIVQRFVTETSTRKLMLETGEVDMALSLTPDKLDRLEGRGHRDRHEKPTMRIFLRVHEQPEWPTLADKRSGGLAYAMDYEGVERRLQRPDGRQLCRFLQRSGGLPATSTRTSWIWRRPRHSWQSRAIRTAALRWRDLSDGDFAFSKTAQSRRLVGGAEHPAQPDGNAWATTWETIGSLDTMVDLILRNYPDFPDSSSIYANQYATAAWGANSWNLSYYSNEQFDALLEQVTETTDEQERARIFQEMAQIVVDDVPNLFVGNLINQVAMRDNVKGYVFNPTYLFQINAYGMYKE